MRAFVVTGPGQGVVRDIEPPSPAPGQVVVDVERAGVCGTDMEFFTGHMAYLRTGEAQYPVRIGHEWCGVVVQAGDTAAASLVGQRVTGDTMLGCGQCRRCLGGRQHLCAARYEIGIRGGWPGALAEQLLVPASAVYPLPADVGAAAGALVEPGGNALRAVHAALAGGGQRLLVMGPGTIGLLAAQIARSQGAEVHLLGRDEPSLRFARELGFGSTWLRDTLPELSFDAVIDASTAQELPSLAAGIVEPGGRVVYIGLSAEPSLLDTRTLVLKDVTAAGVLSASGGLAETISLYASGDVDPRPIVAATVGLDQVATVLAGRRPPEWGNAPKVHIDPRAELAAGRQPTSPEPGSRTQLSHRVLHGPGGVAAPGGGGRLAIQGRPPAGLERSPAEGPGRADHVRLRRDDQGQRRRALKDLTTWLTYRDARVRHVILPEGADGAKTGLDDYLGAGHDAAELAALARDPAGKPPAPAALPPPVPAPVPVPADPAALLDEVREFLCSYVAFPSAAAAVAVTLWAAHTHLVAAFESTPRLALLSPEKQCGKSRVLELLDLICAGAETLSDASPAYLFRRIGAGPVTILLDEADAIWKRGKSDETAEALRSIVNAGHRRSATVGRVEMNGQGAKLTRFRVYAPAAIAGIGNLPDTIMDRAVIVRMRRRAPDERIRGYRERTTRPEGEALRELLAAWAASAAARVGDPWPDMPDGVADRLVDVWEPLLMVADLAGGDWPKRAAEACAAFVAGARDDTASLGTRLLADLYAAFKGADQLSTETILSKLHALDEAPWGDWYGKPLDARQLAKLLKPYGAKPVVVRIGESTPRGYRAGDLHDAWKRYGGSATAATAATSLASAVADVADVADTRQACTVCGEPLHQSFIDAGFTDHGEASQ